MHNKKGGKGIKKKPFNKRMNLTEAQSTEMAMKNLINLRKNAHIISADDVLNRHRTPTEEINVHDRKFGGMFEGEPKEKEKFSDQSAKAYNKEFGKVVEAADVIIEVLDARDPMGSRCIPVENSINLKGKTLVLLINKADLVPKDNLKKWLLILKKEYPTVVFKASTQLQAKRLGRLGIKPQILGPGFTTSMCVGADTLMQLLRSIRLSGETTPSISVGVIGLPNVGKSSVINSLKRSKACSVGAVPGITKHMQEVNIDSKIKLIDCPGLIFALADSSDETYALRNAINPNTLDDPSTAAEAILAKAGYDKMSVHYNIGEITDPSHFLYRLANRRGKMLKKGLPDMNAAASIIINDWNSGKIKYFTEPPYNPVTELTESEQAVVSSLPNAKLAKSIRVGGSGTEAMEVEQSTEDSGLIPPNAQITPDVPTVVQKEPPVKKPRWETKPKFIDYSSVDLRKLRKNDMKKLNKERRRNLQRADDVTNALDAFGGINDDEDDMIPMVL